MKKLLSLLLSALLCLSMAACGNSAVTNDISDASNNPADASSGNEEKDQYYKLGDTVSTDIFEFTLNAAEFTIALNNVNNDDRFAPKEYDPQEDADNPYVAPVGHTYAAFSYTVTNLNRASSEFHNGSFATVKYDGKKYNTLEEGAYFLYEDKQIMDTNGNLKTEKAGQWYSHPSSNFLMMVGAKETRRAYIDISADIQDLSQDVEITFAIPNSSGKTETFTYCVTAEDRMANASGEIEMTLDLALVSFTEDAGQAYFASHLEEYPVLSGEEISGIVCKKWNVDYIIEGMGYWSGTFWFEEDGNIKDDYGYVNERTWEVEDDTLIIDGEIPCQMRKVTDDVYLLVSNDAPYMLMQ